MCHDLGFESFSGRLTERVEQWLASDEARLFPCAELYRHLPALFQLLGRVALDHRVAPPDRAAVLSALKYIVAPYDLIPEGVLGTSGFRDDLVLAAFVVQRLDCSVDAALLREHWPGDGDPSGVARAVLEAGTEMVGDDLCERLRQWLPN